MIVLDTGPIVAAINAADSRHRDCADLLETIDGPLIVPAPVFTEVSYLLEKRAGTHAEATFIAELISGALTLEPLTEQDLRRIHQLITKYSSFPLGAVDASVIAVAERLKSSQVATIDIRHFSVVKPAHIPAFMLLP